MKCKKLGTPIILYQSLLLSTTILNAIERMFQNSSMGLSLSMVVLNNRDWYEIMGVPNFLHFIKERMFQNSFMGLSLSDVAKKELTSGKPFWS